MRTVGVLVLVTGLAGAADPPPKELRDRATAGKDGYTLGKVTIRVTRVAVGETMQIEFRAATDDKAAKVDYKAIRPMNVPVIDDHGNEYRTVRHERFGTPYRSFVSEGLPVDDYFNAEAPIKSAAFLDVDIPGAVVGEKGPFKFRVPRAMWEPAPPKKGPNLPKKK
jgi:hypothetical protein